MSTSSGALVLRKSPDKEWSTGATVLSALTFLAASGLAGSGAPAVGAGAGDFERHVARGKAAAAGGRRDRVGDRSAFHLLGIAALAADQEEAAMRLAGMAAADE